MMARLKIRYFVSRPKKDGTQRYYWQPDKTLRDGGWKMRRLPDLLSEALAAAQEINQAVDQWRANMIAAPVNEKPGTIDALIAHYKNSRHYDKLAVKTKRDYDYYLAIISEWTGDQPAAAINSRMVQNLYETIRPKSQRKAAYLISVLRLLFSHAERESMIPKNTNPATRQAIDYRAKKGTVWSAEQVRLFVRVADEMGAGNIGTAVMLNEWLGQRRGDILRLSINAYRDGALHIRQGKTGAEVVLPIDMIPALKARLELQIRKNKLGKTPGTTIIQTQGGEPYTDGGFLNVFQKISAKVGEIDAEAGKLVFKDLRHTAVTRLAEAGAEIPMIAAVTGHTFKSCQDIIDRYNVRTTRMAQQAFSRRLESETERKEQ